MDRRPRRIAPTESCSPAGAGSSKVDRRSERSWRPREVRSSAGAPAHLLVEQRLQRTPNRALDDPRALRIGMDAVGDVERGNARHAFEVERYECNVVFLRELAKRAPELGGVRRAEIR